MVCASTISIMLFFCILFSQRPYYGLRNHLRCAKWKKREDENKTNKLKKRKRWKSKQHARESNENGNKENEYAKINIFFPSVTSLSFCECVYVLRAVYCAWMKEKSYDFYILLNSSNCVCVHLQHNIAKSTEEREKENENARQTHQNMQYLCSIIIAVDSV